MLRERQVDEPLATPTVDELKRKVAWQVTAAYGTTLDEPVALLEPEPEPPPAADAVAGLLPPVASAPPLPTLADLERLVAEAAIEHPEQVEEWRWYLFYLRDFAHADGSLDDTFRVLIETAFSPLL